MPKFLSTLYGCLKVALVVYAVLCIPFLYFINTRSTGKSTVKRAGAIHTSTFPPTTPYPVGKYMYNGTGYSIDFGEIMMKAKKLSNNNANPVLVTLTNDAYLTTTLSWLCNTKDMDIHQKLLVVTTEEKTKVAIENLWPNLAVVTFNTNMFSGSQVYGKVGYLRIILIRTALIAALINENMEVLLFDTDSLWTQNPLPLMQNSSNVDFVLDPVPLAKRKPEYCLCLLYIYPTNVSKNIFESIMKRFRKVEEDKMGGRKDQQGISLSEMDQVFFAQEIQRYNKIRPKMLDYNEFIDGRWYFTRKLHDGYPRPIVIQNNYILTIPKKIARAKSHGHWFLRQQNNSCDYDQVERAVRNPAYLKVLSSKRQ